jgi:Flp pilus assembly pilin Flp
MRGTWSGERGSAVDLRKGDNDMFELYVYLRNRLEPDEGQTLTEYALIIALVSIALVAALIALAGGIEGVFSEIVGQF